MVTIFLLYVSTETIVPKEFIYLKLDTVKNSIKKKLDIEKNDKIQINVENLSSIN